MKAFIKQARLLKTAIDYRGIEFPGYNKPIKSNRAGKKMMVLAKDGDQVKLIHFGHTGYKHNYSEAAKKSYLARSAGIKIRAGVRPLQTNYQRTTGPVKFCGLSNRLDPS